MFLVLLEVIFCKGAGGYRNLVYFRGGDELSLEEGGVHSCYINTGYCI